MIPYFNTGIDKYGSIQEFSSASGQYSRGCSMVEVSLSILTERQTERETEEGQEAREGVKKRGSATTVQLELNFCMPLFPPIYSVTQLLHNPP